MPKERRKEKADRRLEKVFSNLVRRRDFVAAAAAAGLTITKPQDLAAATATRDEAIIMSYFAFWGGAEGNVEEGGMLTPTQIATMHSPYNDDSRNPNDGHIGPNVPRNTKHEPRSEGNQGPKTAREWLMWRVTKRFDQHYGNWDLWVNYTLSNCARMGVLARRNATKAMSTMVTWEHAFRAFYAVRETPLRVAREALKTPAEVRDQLCD